MKLRHFTIPVFIPEEACPNQCIFCNQHHIAGAVCAPSVDEVVAKVDAHLLTISTGNEVEIGFFGGNFTGIPVNEQKAYLASVQQFIASGRVIGIRISTRPDYITNSILEMLKQYHVSTIELGAQSLDDEVLKLAGRGHTAAQVQEASRMIKENGFKLGLQMMIGLPGDTVEKSLFTAREIIRLGANCTRIYPTLVIKDTELEQLYLQGKYNPLSPEEAVSRVADIVPLFIAAGVKILRIGLHPSEGLLNNTSLVAGPFHVAFGEMAFSEIWRRILSNLVFENGKRNILTLTVSSGMRNAAIGHKAMNKAMLLENFRKVVFIERSDLKGFEYHAHTA
ncbi:MAG: radical SAM protein [Lentimicrobiaceae bacterium]|jgi:histone acetyltransferase (RNA polymerase elongator complex component)